MVYLSRREFLAGAAGFPAVPRRPNVVLILTDQQRFDALCCAGNPIVRTPNLDRLAEEGARFTEATCSSPLCGPSRASLLTGQYQHGHRCGGNYEVTQNGMPEEVETCDEILAAAGYHVEYHGKWHVGSANRKCYSGGLPYFLDRYYEYLRKKYPARQPRNGEAVDRYTRWPYRHVPVDRMMLRASEQGYVMPHHNEAGEFGAPSEDSLTAWTAGRVVEFLRGRPEQPFAVTCSILHPHAPLVASKPYFGMYDPAKMPMPRVLDDVFTPRRKSAIPDVLTLTPDGLGSFMSLYYGLVTEVDTWVGHIMDALRASGQAENTLVVFTSDHGEMLGEHARVSKSVFYEGAIRVPLLMRFPGRIPRRTRIDAAATGADIAPTILDYVGLQPPRNMHGRSLRRLIEGGRAEPGLAYCELGADPTGRNAQRIIRTREWKLAYHSGQPYLYDLTRDRHETNNLLAAEHRTAGALEEGRRMKQRLIAHLEELGSPETSVIRSFRV